MSFRGNLLFLKHQLQLFGLALDEEINKKLIFLDSPSSSEFVKVDDAIKQGGVLIALKPTRDFLALLNVLSSHSGNGTWIDLNSEIEIGNCKRLLRSFHDVQIFFNGSGDALVCDSTGGPAWLSIQYEMGCILLVGTDVEADILRLRQGDPRQTAIGQNGVLWGIAGERPNYLYEPQLDGLPKGNRQADYWGFLLAQYIAEKIGAPLKPILPNGAPGAVIITGDDDQAYLEKYKEQLDILDNTPITYFLHPLTRHTPKTLKSMFRGRHVDLGIHPDALEQPKRYRELLREQCSWFTKLTKHPAVSVRNHGFLNNGYWGHLSSWISEGIRFSSNIPGLDGRVLNGSLLPARVSLDGELTSHWSVLTAIGDGVRFISGMTDEDAAKCITDLADSIRESGIPGIIVLNLHPQNIGETKAMHLAALEVIKSGFVPWTMSECLEWFEQVDNPQELQQAHCWAEGLRKIKNYFFGAKALL